MKIEYHNIKKNSKIKTSKWEWSESDGIDVQVRNGYYILFGFYSVGRWKLLKIITIFVGGKLIDKMYLIS